MELKKVLAKGYEILKDASIDTYQLDSQLLLGKVINKDRLFIFTNPIYDIDESKVEEYIKLINLRKEKMPIKYILGNCEFMGLEFIVQKGVLIPRPDTEILIESMLSSVNKNYEYSICDLCCGSGVIGISLAYFMNKSKIDCYDISDKAYEITNKNIDKFCLNDRVSVKQSDLLEEAIENKKKFDILVSNPPYIKEEVIDSLMRDVKEYEPFEALSGGEDGLFFYKKIIKQSLKVLKKGGIIAFEIGHDQKEDVTKLLQEYGYGDIVCIKDLAYKDRVVKAVRTYV